MIKLVVLDMAGTTVQDLHEVEACFAEAAQQSGLQITEAEILAAQGWSKRFVFETYWEKQLRNKNDVWEEKVEKSFLLFKEILEDYYRSNPVYPTEGCQEVFEFLNQAGIPIVLTTGFYRKVANIILEKLGWLNGLDATFKGTSESIIQLSITSDEVAAGRPAPDMIHKAMQSFGITDPSSVVKLGDTPSDLKAGRAAQCGRVYGLTNGTHSEMQLIPYDNDGLLSSLHELLPLLKAVEA